MYHNSLQEAGREVEKALEKLLPKFYLHQGGGLSLAAENASGLLSSVAESDLNKGRKCMYCCTAVEVAQHWDAQTMSDNEVTGTNLLTYILFLY